ncbi:proteoglycan 4-like [Penaeus chinensis]|uniref:proteoglycan 4-like n=1 Tax=Penaeus chinensis TaxID=139456 RepID=UPI001FB5A9CC|nr:proteoglycan 4-like [Penaeus chinensis]
MSEQSLVSTFQEFPPGGGLAAQIHRTASVQERLLDGKKVLTSFGPVSRPVVRVVKPKGPAPPPPIKPKPRLQTTPMIHQAQQEYDDEEPDLGHDASAAARREEETQAYESTRICAAEIAPEPPVRTESLLRDAHPGIAKRVTALERALPLPVIEENIKNTRKRPAPQPRNILPLHSDGESSREASLTRQQDRRPPKPESAKPPKPDAAKPPRPEVRKPPRSSLLEKPLRLADKNMMITRPGPAGHAAPAKPERKRAEGDSAANLRRLEEVLTNILDHGAPPLLRATKSDENIAESVKAADARAPKGILKKGPKPPSKPSKYEVAHREALEDSRALLERLPRGELQRNKIVLRVPSFRTAGCPDRGTNLSVAPRYRTDTAAPPVAKPPRAAPAERWGKGGRREEPQEAAATDGSSSSGYSSPEVSSKEPSPPHSGPPSPASSSAAPSDEDERRCGDANVTVIEINKGDAASGRARAAADRPPPRPPKPLRLRHVSDAAALVSSQGGLLVPVHRRTAPLPLYEDVFGLAALTENVMLLTEAINPVLVHATRPHDGAGGGATAGAPSTAPRVVDVIRKTLQGPMWDGRTAVLPRPRPALRTHSLSLPRPSVTSTGRPHVSRGSRSPSPVRREEQRQQVEKQNSASSTAAYLASLELLASHYRHQALANAKQLQLQQRLLMQQQQQQQQQQQPHQQEQQEQQETKLKEETAEVTEATEASPPAEAIPNPASSGQPASESRSPIEQESEC